jgi:RNA polymerase primary sigma factor
MGYDEKARKCSLRSRGRGESEVWMREVLASWEEGMREVEREKGEVVAANMGLVYGLAGKFVRGAEGLEFEDLVQEGGIALMKAVDKFEVKRGLRFSTYATWWVRQALTRAIGESRGVMRAPVHVLESFAAMKRMEAKCWREGMGKVGDEELDLLLGWPAGKVSDLRAKMRGELAGAYGVTSGMRLAVLEGDKFEDGDALGDRINGALMEEMSGCAQGGVGGGFGASYEESRAEQERDEAVRKLLGRLGEQEREVIMMRFGIAGNRVMTLEEVGARFGVTRERIRQIEMNAMGALRGEGARHLMKKWGQI